jgi:hypothetical protein
MAKYFQLITEEEIANNSVKKLANRPSSPSRYGESRLTAEEVKEAFDKLPRLIAQRYNTLISQIRQYGGDEIITTAYDGNRKSLNEIFSELESGLFANALKCAKGGESLSVFYEKMRMKVIVLNGEPTEYTVGQIGTILVAIPDVPATQPIETVKLYVCTKVRDNRTYEWALAAGGGSDDGIASIEQTKVSTEDGGENIITIFLKSGEAIPFSIYNGGKGSPGDKGDPGKDGTDGEDGEDGVGIESITQTASSSESGGINVVTVKLTNGISHSFEVRNGKEGKKGDTGEGFKIAKIYTSISAMNVGYSTDGVPIGGFVLINTNNPDDPDNSKLYVKGNASYTYLNDLSGAQGIQGTSGVGIESVEQTTTSDEDGGTNIVTVTLTNGTASELEFKNGSTGKNGKDGKDGVDGKDGENGTNGKDGTSVTHSWNGTTLTVTSASGTSSVDLKGENGKDGKDGTNGTNGTNGKDGTSVTHSWNGTTLTVTSASGTSSADLKGPAGNTGKSAYQQAVDGGYTGSEVEFEQKLARDIPTVTQTTGNSKTLVMSQEAVTNLVDSINVLPFGGSKEWLEKNGDKTKLYQIDGYVWGYVVSNGWTKSGTQFNIVSSESQMTGASEIQYFLRNGSNGTVYEYHEASGDVGVPVYSSKPTTANEGDIIAVGGRKYKASITSKQEPDYTNLAKTLTNGKRINSSGVLVDADACTCEDYIPFGSGAVVRVRGLGNLSTQNCIVYKAIGAMYATTKVTADTKYTSYSYDSTTDTVTLASTGYTNGDVAVTHIRIVGKLSGSIDDVIITLNEEIKTKTVTSVVWNDIGEYVPPVAAGWSETDETYSVIDSLSATANSGDTAVYSVDGFLYTYISGADWMATSKYTTRQLDNSLSETSSNAVQNKVVTAAINAVTYTANKNANEILSLRNDVEALGTSSSDVVTIPSYWESMVANKTATVKALQEVGGKNCVCFAYASDTHIPDNDNGRTNDIGKVMAKMLDNCEIPFAVITGDVATRASFPTEEEYIAQQSQVKKHLAPLWGTDRLLMALGNHDGCYGDSSGYYRKQFSPERMWDAYFRSQSLDFKRVFSDDGLYYYVDNIPQKTRFIILNSQYAGEYAVHENGFAVNNRFSTSCYGQAQLDWFSSVALDMPEGYGALIFTHVPFNVTYTVDKAQIIGIIDAYNGKKSFTGNYTGGVDGWSNSRVNVNFSGAKGEIIAVVAGHVHGDSVDTDSASCPVITILSAGASANEPYKETAPTRTKGTDTETSFDVVTVNRKTRTIYCTRIGAGNDRTINY